jgi:hypothetical protein
MLLKENGIVFNIEERTAFELPFTSINRAVIQTQGAASKNDVSVEFHVDDTTEDVST